MAAANNDLLSASHQHRLRLADLEIDPKRQQVSRAGEVLQLPPLSYQLLLALVDTAPAVLSHDVMIDRVWVGRVVSPETITQRVKLLRQAIGDDAASPKYIGLVRGGGYRLLPEVLSVATEPETVTRGLVGELSRRRVPQVAAFYVAAAWSLTEALAFVLETVPIFPAWSGIVVAIGFVIGFPIAMFLAWRFDIGADGIRRTEPSTARGQLTIVGAVGLLVTATAGLSYLLVSREQVAEDLVSAEPAADAPTDVVALLPFVVAETDPEVRNLYAGLNDALRDSLRDYGLRMVARTSSQAFRDRAILMTEVSTQLGAGSLVEGVVGQSDGKIRISLAIINGADGLERWTKTFEESLDNLAKIQREVATELVAQLAPGKSLLPSDKVGSDSKTYNLMLLARHFEQEVRDRQVVDYEQLDRAIDLYNQVVDASPNSALAHSRLGGALLYRSEIEAAREPIHTALKLDPELADVQYTLGLYYWATSDDRAGKAYARAVELDPNHTDALGAYAKWLWFSPNYETPLAYFKRAVELDPMTLQRYADLGSFYGWRGDRAEAHKIAAQVAQRFASHHAHEVVARMYEITGDLDVAIAWAWKGRASAPERAEEPSWQLSELYGRIGDVTTGALLEDRGMGQLYWERSYVELADTAEELIFDRPEEANIYYMLGFAYNAQGKYSAAARILRLSGLPESVYAGSRRSSAEMAMYSLADALIAGGNREEGLEINAWLLNHFETGMQRGAEKSPWSRVFTACSLLNLGEKDQALANLEWLKTLDGFAFDPFLLDSPCFATVAEDSRYLSVVTAVAQRKAELRRSLPKILEQLGVAKFANQYLLNVAAVQQ